MDPSGRQRSTRSGPVRIKSSRTLGLSLIRPFESMEHWSHPQKAITRTPQTILIVPIYSNLFHFFPYYNRFLIIFQKKHKKNVFPRNNTCFLNAPAVDLHELYIPRFQGKDCFINYEHKNSDRFPWWKCFYCQYPEKPDYPVQESWQYRRRLVLLVFQSCF